MKLMLAQIPRSSALPPVLNSRRSAGQLPQKCPCRRRLDVYQARRTGMAGRPTPALTAKGQGRARRRCVR